jgi:hypothetical protein
VGLRVAFVSGAVVALDFEKQVCISAASAGQRRRDFPQCASLGLRCPSAASKIRYVLRKNLLPWYGRFKIADAPIRLLQSDRLGGLRVPQSFQMGRVESWSESDLVGINS